MLELSRITWRGNFAESHHFFWKQMVPADFFLFLMLGSDGKKERWSGEW